MTFVLLSLTIINGLKFQPKKLQPEILKLNKSFKSDSRLILRKSGTENKIRVMIEAKNKAFANNVILKIKNLLKDLNKWLILHV